MLTDDLDLRRKLAEVFTTTWPHLTDHPEQSINSLPQPWRYTQKNSSGCDTK
ncbi:hypothetical protein GCM10009733_008450 [Nonomuraea maheshkhaliensis]|uniref:Uncharacterized protein n=1 Tax=Nonomuraea maheshkhaliensis TaxID=419590 RepID=A0ABP4QMF3_9ACTN